MKISILHDFKSGPWGGGNQFLKAFKDRLNYSYVDVPAEADVILVNSKDNHEEAKFLKGLGKTIVHRIDGVFSLYRGPHEKATDQKVYDFAEQQADGVIFQSRWSKEAHLKNGMKLKKPSIVVHNFVDRRIFNKHNCAREKLSLVSTSWSSNPRKGFKYLEFLDQGLDFARYSFTFVGNSPVKFKNIKMVAPVPSQELAEILKTKQVFVTASQYDTCSNSLIEAMSCGCIPLVLKDGGNAEVIGNRGDTFENSHDLLNKIDHVFKFLKSYQAIDMDDPWGWEHLAYLRFMEEVHAQNKH
jgi:glycosyltransferase involved in cell wall biosynthesis